MGTRKTTFGTSTKLTTFMTELASVVRFNFINNNTLSFSFVLDEELELVERPITNPKIHSFASTFVPDTFQVFHYNLVTFKLCNNIFTDVVVNPSHVTSFLTRQLPKKSCAGSCAFGLQYTTQIFKLPFDLLDFSRIIKPVVRTDSEVIYSEINTQNKVLRTNVLLSGCNLFRECEQEERPAFFIHPQEAFTDVPIEIFSITIRDFEFELLPGLEQSENQNILFDVSTSGEIITHTGMFDDRFILGFFDHACCLFEAANSELSWQFEPFPNLMVKGVLQVEVFGDFMFPCIINTKLERFSMNRDSFNYFRSCSDFNFSSSIRSHNSRETKGVYKHYGEGCPVGWRKAFPPMTKVKGFQSKEIR